MERKKIHAINVERLTRWKDQLTNHHSTPVLLLGVGHDHKSGELHICVTEDLTDTEVLFLAQRAVELITAKVIKQN